MSQQPLGKPYWWEGIRTLPHLSHSPPQKTELLIIGAGYTGLSAALTAVNEGAKVLVVDAGIPGEGASTRNGGMAGAHPRLSLAAMSEKFGAKTARGIFNEATPAFNHLQALIKTYGIDCDYQQTGRIQLAWTKADFTAQKALAADMNMNTDFPVEVVSKPEIGMHLSTQHYFGGLLYRDHGSVHPKKLNDGLLNAALNAGVEIIQNCLIQNVRKCKTGFEAVWDGGSILANKVILATNGYTQGNGVMNWLSRRVFPLPSYLIATEPLPKTLIDELAIGRRMMVETRARHSYWRISPDGMRIIWGGRAAIRPIDINVAAKRLHETMSEIWPQLKGVNISHAWTGNTGFSFNSSAKVGTINDMHFAMGYCGGGVVLAPYLGMKVAYQALDDPRGKTAYSETSFKSRPYYFGGKPWFLDIADAWYSYVVDAKQNRSAARDHASED